MPSVKTVTEDDREAIRKSVERWLEAGKKGDLATMLELLADDVLFIVPGQEPFGKQAFAAANKKQMQDMQMDATIDIKEIEVAGEWAWMRSFLNVTFTRDGKAAKHSGHILNIWQKNSAGRWVIKRDANFVKPEGA
mgnify:CR=1 FL=1|jgi:uncharacterized protein (TIGR02246 family)